MNKLAIGTLLASLATAGLCNQASDNMAAMSEKGRRNLSAMLIRQTGETCPSAQRTFMQGSIDKSTFWNVTCARESYAIVFLDDAANTVRVMKCAQVTSLGAPTCFKKIKN